MLTLKSNSFNDGSPIPAKYTCTGENISPQLTWQDAPENANSYLLIVDDPDAQRVVGKTFVHWMILLPKDASELAEGISGKKSPSSVGIEFNNDFNTTFYGGPCPPKGSGKHTYRFTLFALSRDMQEVKQQVTTHAPLTAEATKQLFGKDIVGEARITGTYEK